MKRFFCQCGNEVFFHNLFCMNCGRDLGYDSDVQTLWSGEIARDGIFHTQTSEGKERTFKLCGNRETSVRCNWFLPNQTDCETEQCQCIACRTTQTVPDQSLPQNVRRWKRLEKSKRQLFNTLLDLNLLPPEGDPHITFDYLEDQRSNPNVAIEHVLTGHCDGLITLNAAEADEGFLHTMKEQMQERYRTLLGHYRHEIGHYYWLKLIAPYPVRLARFRSVFGDESEDYQAALQKYYDKKQRHWRNRFISQYASSHPHEDWAETWAHYLHMVDTLETAVSYGLSIYQPKLNDFDQWFTEWGRVTQIMNGLNRSMGLANPYPFVVSPIVQGKLRFIDELVDSLLETI